MSPLAVTAFPFVVEPAPQCGEFSLQGFVDSMHTTVVGDDGESLRLQVSNLGAQLLGACDRRVPLSEGGGRCRQLGFKVVRVQRVRIISPWKSA